MAQVGSSIDRFLIRASIALAFLMIGVVLGFSLAVLFPKPGEPSQLAVAAAPEPRVEPPSPSAESQAAAPEPEAEAEPEPVVGETAGNGDGDGDGDTDGEAEAEPEPEPTPGAEPQPLSGDLIVEVRDVTGEARTKNDIREVVKQHGHEFEACIGTHSPGLTQARTFYQLYVTPNGKVAGSLLLQGLNPELDACVEQAIEGWNFGVAGDNSFVKIKLVWTA